MQKNQGLLKHSTIPSNSQPRMYRKLTDEAKQELDERVIELLTDEGNQGEELKTPPQGEDENRKEKEIYADCSFYDEV